MQLNDKIKTICLICTSLILILSSCKDSDNFSSDTSLKLELETEAIEFDTVFTALGSASRNFKIYNRNNKSLAIESIHLMDADKSGFTLNIDGSKGTYLTNIDVLKKDSIFGFVKLTVNPLNKDNPTIIRDTIKFVTNGNVQKIALEAIGQDVHITKGLIIEKNTVLDNKKPYLIYDSIVVEENVVLNLEAGTRFYFRNKASLVVKGTLIAKGSVEKPIRFGGDRLDMIEGDISFDNVPGQWDGIYFHAKSYGNHLENLHTKNAINGMTFLASSPNQVKAILINTIVHNSAQSGLFADNCKISAINSVFTNSKAATLELRGGDYNFFHCTVANYFRWSSRQEPTLIVSNISRELEARDFIKSNFSNSIIYGSAREEILLEKGRGGEFLHSYQFDNCLIKHEDTTDKYFVNCLWNEDPLFENINIAKDYLYSFRLSEGSPAINNANKDIASNYPFDMNGDPRLNDQKPDIGAYEWKANTEE